MINKDKIFKVDIYGQDGVRLLTTGSFSFPKDFFRIKGWELVAIKAKDLPVLKKEEKISAVFEYINGTRIKCETKVDISTPYQMNFRVDEGEVMEERRGSYKVNTPGAVADIIRIEKNEDEVVDMVEPYSAKIININLSGVLMNCDLKLSKGEIITMRILNGTIELRGEVLRRQLNDNNEFVGYGCKFLDVSKVQEEKIAKYIFDCQIAERDRRKKV